MRILLGLLLLCIAPIVNAQTISSFALGNVSHLTLGNAENLRPLKWAEGLGKPVVLRWAMVRTPIARPHARNCGLVAPFALLSENPEQRLTEIHMRGEIETALARWSSVAGVNFEYTTDQETANVLFGEMRGINGWAFTDVEVARQTGDVDTITKAVICLNPEKKWSLNKQNDTSYSVLRTTEHETGHALGFDHPKEKRCPEDGAYGVLNYREYGDIRISVCEMRAVQRYYGPPILKTPSG